jgi:putative lipoprotein
MNPAHVVVIACLAAAVGCQPRAETTDSATMAADTAMQPVAATSGLGDGEWALVALRGQPAPMGAGSRPATLRFDTDSNRVSGFSGCNRAAGGFTTNGDSLTFSPLAMTRMMCTEGMELERSYAEVVGATRTFRLTADTLELVDQAGTVSARFERRAVAGDST